MKNLFYGVDVRKLDLESWPTVEAPDLKGKTTGGRSKAELYQQRQAAMRTLIDSEGDSLAAAQVGGCSPQEVGRIFRRCIATHKDGRINGFRACVPWHRTKKSQFGPGGTSTAGRFTRFLHTYPKIAEKLLLYALGRDAGAERLHAPPPADLRHKLLEWSREAGIPLTEYPRNTSEGAIKTLQKWQANLANTHGRAYIEANFGESAGHNYDGGTEAFEAAMDPYRIMVFDEYTINAFASVGVSKSDGSIEWRPMSRFSSINGRRRGSRDVTVCHPVLSKQADSVQFLEALERAIRPHQRRQFTIPGLEYPAGPCFASDLTDGAWILPDLILFDSAKIHWSSETRRALTQNLGCIILSGVVKRPKARGDVESWHSSLSGHFCRSPSTAGYGPGDPQRRDPETAAVKLRLTADHLAQSMEILHARFGTGPLKSLKAKTPMEALQDWLTDPDTIVRHLPTELRETFCLCELRVKVRISCDLESGRQPVVRFKHAEYIGPILGGMRTADGEECTLVLNPQQAHVARLYRDATEVDVLKTRGEWREPHRLCDREFYGKLMRSRKVRPASQGQSPLLIIAEYLRASALNSKDDALVLANLGVAHPNLDAAPTVEPPPPPPSDTASDEHLKNKLSSSGDW